MGLVYVMCSLQTSTGRGSDSARLPGPALELGTQQLSPRSPGEHKLGGSQCKEASLLGRRRANTYDEGER